VLDPFSATLYSSSPATFAKIEAQVANGRTMAEAIERVAYPDKAAHPGDARP
jgi:conjugal transfer ATP-binding protein TraC